MKPFWGDSDDEKEIEMYYDLLGFKFVAAIGALYATELVDVDWVGEIRANFFDKIKWESELYFRLVAIMKSHPIVLYED